MLRDLSASEETLGDRAIGVPARCRTLSNSKGRSLPARRRPIPPGMIPRGLYAGLPRRTRTDRTKALTLDQVREQTNAFEFADQQGRPLTVALTIAWNMMEGFEPNGWMARWSRTQTRLLKSAAEWLARRDIEPTWVWVRECSASLWCHTHLQLHLPRIAKGKRTGALARELVEHLKRSFRFAPAGIKAVFGTFGMWTKGMRQGEFIYQLKGIDHRAFKYISPEETVNIAAAIGVEHRGTQGTIPIKRAGTTENISRSARHRAGWHERRSLDELRQIIRPPQSPPCGLILGRRGLRDIILKPTALAAGLSAGRPSKPTLDGQRSSGRAVATG